MNSTTLDSIKPDMTELDRETSPIALEGLKILDPHRILKYLQAHMKSETDLVVGEYIQGSRNFINHLFTFEAKSLPGQEGGLIYFGFQPKAYYITPPQTESGFLYVERSEVRNSISEDILLCFTERMEVSGGRIIPRSSTLVTALNGEEPFREDIINARRPKEIIEDVLKKVGSHAYRAQPNYEPSALEDILPTKHFLNYSISENFLNP